MTPFTTILATTVMISLGGGPPAPQPNVDVNSPAAHALLAGLRAAGITYSRADQVVMAAQAVCRMAADGKSASEIGTEVATGNAGLTEDDVTKFVALAEQSYCPPPAPQEGAGGG